MKGSFSFETAERKTWPPSPISILWLGIYVCGMLRWRFIRGIHWTRPVKSWMTFGWSYTTHCCINPSSPLPETTQSNLRIVVRGKWEAKLHDRLENSFSRGNGAHPSQVCIIEDGGAGILLYYIQFSLLDPTWVLVQSLLWPISTR